MPRMTGKAQGVDRNYSLKIEPDLYGVLYECTDTCIVPIVPAQASSGGWCIIFG